VWRREGGRTRPCWYKKAPTTCAANTATHLHDHGLQQLRSRTIDATHVAAERCVERRVGSVDARALERANDGTERLQRVTLQEGVDGPGGPRASACSDTRHVIDSGGSSDSVMREWW
jgi:hypothetical protein